MAKREISGSRGILTGASSGIGRALGWELVREGAKLVAVARRGDRLHNLVGELTVAGGRIEPVIGDITLPEVRQQVLDLAIKRFGGLDFLINNAGIGAMGRFDEAPPERLRQVMEVNFFAAAEMMRLAAPYLKQGNNPIVVNIGSILGHRGIPFCAEYCASKFALRGLSESLRAEWSSAGIDVLLVSPGTTDTEFFESAIDAAPPPWRKSQGMTTDFVAASTIAAMRRGRKEIILGSGRMVVWLNRHCPGLMDRIMARYG